MLDACALSRATCRRAIRSIRASGRVYPGRIPLDEAKEVMGFPPDFRIPAAMVGESIPPPMARYIATVARERIL